MFMVTYIFKQKIKIHTIYLQYICKNKFKNHNFWLFYFSTFFIKNVATVILLPTISFCSYSPYVLYPFLNLILSPFCCHFIIICLFFHQNLKLNGSFSPEEQMS